MSQFKNCRILELKSFEIKNIGILKFMNIQIPKS